MRLSRRRAPLMAGLLALLAAAAPAATQAADPGAPQAPAAAEAALSEADVGAFVDGVMAGQFQQHHLAGAVVAVVKDGRVLLSRGYGFADVARGIPADPARTAIRPGSVSKLVTWTAVMQLAERGRIDLDADLDRYLTKLEIPPGPGGPVTMRHLLTHAPGFDDVPPGVLAKLSPSELVPLSDALAAHPPARVRPPGQVSAYSNYGAALAGLIVQEVSGEPFDAYVQRHVFAPLGMTSSTFAEPLPEPLAGRLAQGYAFRGGRLEPGPFEYIHSFAPTGSMTTTAQDMARFMLAHLQDGRLDGRQVLAPDTARAMRARAFGPDPRAPGMALGFYEMQASGRTLLTHKGATTFFKSQLALLPDEAFGVFVSYNAAEGGPAAEALIRALVARYFAADPPAFPPRAAPPPEEAAGAYRTTWHSQRTFGRAFLFGRDVEVTVARNGDLIVAEAGAQRRYKARPDGVYRDVATQEPLVVRQADGKTWIHRGNPVMALEKLPLAEQSATHRWALGLGFAGALASVLISLWRLLVRRTDPRRRLAAHAMAGASLVFLLFALGLAALMASPAGAAIAWRTPPLLRDLVWLPPLGVLIALVATAIALALNRRSLADPGFLTGGAAAVLLGWSLHYWNLMGPHFG